MSSSGWPVISSVSMEADAWLMAQPRPVNATSSTRPSSPMSSISVMRSPHSGLRALEGRRRAPAACRSCAAAGSAPGSRRGRGRPWDRVSVLMMPCSACVRKVRRRSTGARRQASRRRVAAPGSADAGIPAEDALHAAQAGRQAVEVVAVAVDVEAGARRGRLAQALVERLRAVVAGADGDRLAVEERGHVVRVDVRQVEGHDAGPLVRGARAVDGGCPAPRAAARPARTAVSDRSWARTSSMPMAARYSTAAPEADGGARCPGVPASNFQGMSLQVGAAQVDLADHLAAAHERRHRLEQLPAGPERTGAGGPQHLVAGEDVEVGVPAPAHRRAGAAPPGRRRRARARRPHGPRPPSRGPG